VPEIHVSKQWVITEKIHTPPKEEISVWMFSGMTQISTGLKAFLRNPKTSPVKYSGGERVKLSNRHAL
jgi:hypothetical protein